MKKPNFKPYEQNTCGRPYNLLNVKLLDNCNGKCSFCIAAGTPHSLTSTPEEFIKRILEQTEFNNVDLLGGEPTLYKGLIDVLKGIRPYKENIGIITNGSNLDILKKTIDYLDRITISIHSFDYNKNSTGIVIDEEKLIDLNNNKKNVETIAATVCTKETVCTIKDIREYAYNAKRLGFSAIKLMELVTSNEEVDFVDLQDLLIYFNIHQKNPSLKGCFFELSELSHYLGIKTYIKLNCPFNCIFKAMNFGIPDNIEYQHNYINVIHPDCTVTDSWVYASYENKILNGGNYNVNYED